MTEPVQAMTAAFPQIGVGDAIHIVEVEDAIRPAVHHRERNRARPDDLPLVDAFSGACSIEQPFAEPAVSARDSIVKEWFGRGTEDRLDEGVDISIGQVLPAGGADMR